MDGTYIATVRTPFGTKQGRLILTTNNGKLSGSIGIMGMQSNFTEGTIIGNTCKFSGIFRSRMGRIQYEATGILNENEMKLTANTSRGLFEFIGKKQ